jgi:uncharacterized protein YebE (UPF0316 family)
MDFGLDPATLLTGLAIFCLRICDVSLGTVRTISTVHGRTKVAFFLGLVEITIWITVISTVVSKIADKPILGLFYAVGFSTGNVVGIMLERKLALGTMIIRVITPGESGLLTAERLRNAGHAVTVYHGEGMAGPVLTLYIACRRRDVDRILGQIRATDPKAFYITEQAGSVSKIYRPTMQPSTGWRAILKKK